MGRRERPVDPAAGPVQRFAYELRKLRDEAGLTYRQLAAKCEFSVTTLSQAAAGEKLPSLPVVLAYARACGGDPADWERRWREADADEAAEPPSEDAGAEPPYRGLARFEPADQEAYFGREQLTEDVVELVRGHRFAAVFGPSGSGKSSLLRAGLVPAVRAEGAAAVVRILTPGEHPERHAEALVPAAGDGDTYVLVDQFEEVFTLCQDVAERARFLDLLLAAREPDSRLRVVIAVRADFYGRCAEHRELAEALRAAQLLVGPMSPAELRAAIVKPAAAARLIVERELTARLLSELDGEPGGLPLMSHVLLETWRRRRGRALTLQSYEAAGGLRGAVAATAERAYGELTGAQAEVARRILLRLIAPGEGAQDTRRPVDRGELEVGEPADVRHVLELLARARLLTLSEDTVDLAHEALIGGWPRLAGWIEEDRERMRELRRLTEAAQVWEELDRDVGALYRGSRLGAAEERFGGAEHAAELTAREAAFLDASLAARGRELRRGRSLAAVLGTLVVLALIAGVIAWQQNREGDRQHLEAEARRIADVADSLRHSDPVDALRLSVAAWKLAETRETRAALLGAYAQRQEAAFTVPNGKDPGAQHFLSGDGRTVVSAGQDRVTRWDAVKGRRLGTYKGLGEPGSDAMVSMAADGRTMAHTKDEPGIEVRRLGGDGAPGKTTTLKSDAIDAALSLSGRLAVVTEDMDSPAELKVVPTSGGKPLLTRKVGGEQTTFDAISPDDRQLALCLDGGPLELWDLRKERKLPLRGDLGEWAAEVAKTKKGCDVDSVWLDFTPDGRTLTVQAGNELRAYDVRSGRGRLLVKRGGLKDTYLSVSADGSMAAGVVKDDILVWKAGDPETPVLRYPLMNEDVSDLRLDMKAGVLRYLGGTSGGVVRTLSLRGLLSRKWPQTSWDEAEFSADGRHWAGQRQRSDGRVELAAFDSRTGRRAPGPPKQKCGSDCWVRMALDADGRTLGYTTQSMQGGPEAADTVRLWDLRRGKPAGSRKVGHGWGSEVRSMAFAPDGKSLQLAYVPEGEYVEVWDARLHDRKGKFRDVGGDVLAGHPKGRVLLTDQGEIVDLPSGKVRYRTLTLGTPMALAFDPAGRLLAAGDDSGRVTLWNGTARHRLGTLPGTYDSAAGGSTEPVSGLAFSPDGSMLAVAGENGTLQLWDTESRQPLGGPLPTPGDSVLAVSFAPDGSRVRAVGNATGLRSYPVSAESVRRTVCERVGSGLSRADWETYLPSVGYRRTC
ncbi:helix-turn-helix domain-containing protein [Streptomyces boninensis]|uniref:nSTAND1 domain-containing NTPase n=1 Tax=Streptomyces boninensis TaxID=2039455 RepID=UPI003B21C5F3